MDIYICQVCGHVEFNDAPENCPVCFSGKDKFKKDNNVFADSAENSPEGAVKHVPVVNISKVCGLVPESSCTDVLVRVGETLHPMTEKHFITYIDCYIDDSYVCRLMLSPNGTNPATIFHLSAREGNVTIVSRCNLHGYWVEKKAI